MASPRITNSMRTGIIKNTVEHTFKKRAEQLIANHAKLANRAYDEAFDKKTQKAMADLGENYLRQDNDIDLNIGGQAKALDFAGLSWNLRTKDYADAFIYNMKHQYKFVRQNGYRHVPSDPLRADIEKQFNDEDDFVKDVQRAAIQLNAMLESVTTFKKLRAVWPQGEKFYDMYDVDAERPGVPAVVVTELNKILGL